MAPCAAPANTITVPVKALLTNQAFTQAPHLNGQPMAASRVDGVKAQFCTAGSKQYARKMETSLAAYRQQQAALRPALLQTQLEEAFRHLLSAAAYEQHHRHSEAWGQPLLPAFGCPHPRTHPSSHWAQGASVASMMDGVRLIHNLLLL
jgi:hypothetical protein